MLVITERLLFTRELKRLQRDFKNCSDYRLRKAIIQDILLMLKALFLTARK